MQELARAVQRVHNPDAAMQQALAVVMRLFREPGVLGERPEQRLAQRVVDFHVGLGDHLVAESLAAPVLPVGALLPSVAGAGLLEALEDRAALAGGFPGGFEFGLVVHGRPLCRFATSPLREERKADGN